MFVPIKWRKELEDGRPLGDGIDLGCSQSTTQHTPNYQWNGRLWQCTVCGSLKKAKTERNTCRDMSSSQTKLGFHFSKSSTAQRIGKTDEVRIPRLATMSARCRHASADLGRLALSQEGKEVAPILMSLKSLLSLEKVNENYLTQTSEPLADTLDLSESMRHSCSPVVPGRRRCTSHMVPLDVENPIGPMPRLQMPMSSPTITITVNGGTDMMDTQTSSVTNSMVLLSDGRPSSLSATSIHCLSTLEDPQFNSSPNESSSFPISNHLLGIPTTRRCSTVPFIEGLLRSEPERMSMSLGDSSWEESSPIRLPPSSIQEMTDQELIELADEMEKRYGKNHLPQAPEVYAGAWQFRKRRKTLGLPRKMFTILPIRCSDSQEKLSEWERMRESLHKKLSRPRTGIIQEEMPPLIAAAEAGGILRRTLEVDQSKRLGALMWEVNDFDKCGRILRTQSTLPSYRFVKSRGPLYDFE